MEAGGMLPGRDPSIRAEVVHESERTRVTRLFLAERTVIRKEPLGPDAERRLRHEAAILDRLRGVAGLAQLAEAPRYPGSIVLEDAGGTSLASPRPPPAAADLIGLAIGLAQAVAGMHRRGVIHRDITPANIVLSRDGTPGLVDFTLATSLAEMRPEFTHHTEIVGTLAYMAPEQTGRTGHPVDQRADLYALGATLYELATGAPPFGTGDPLQLIHDHLARVPAPPADAHPAVPVPLSGIIVHLLEKEPDNRYQTADGVIYDLERSRDARMDPESSGLRIGEHDVPLRLLPPSRLVGRDDEVAALGAAFEEALANRCRGVLVTGSAGVGKTALIDQLRTVVTGRDGWFVAGKFDQYRRDLEFDAGYQAFRALGRLLLAEPEDELVRLREQILSAAGPNAGLLTAVLPEFAALLAVPPDPGDPLTAQARAQRAAAAALRAVASRKRPVVLFLDDLQWAGRTPAGLVDIVLSEEPIEGLLLAGAYRESDVDAAHPLAAPLSRWLGQAMVRQLRLVNLPAPSLVTMVAEMLRVDRPAAAALAGMISPHTSGNPYETVELLNALRRDGMLTATAAGWRWDSAAVRAHLGRSEVAELLAARVDALPPASRQMLEAMACLGGRAELSLLQPAAAASASAVDQALAPALAEGLLVTEPGARPAVRFRHDRIREAIVGGLDPGRRQALQLAMARRLAAVPELFAVAAEQYLPAVGAVADAAERRQVVGLLRRAADQATLIGDHALVYALLTAALAVVEPGETATLAEVHAGRHTTLYCLGRLEEADEEYRTIERLCPAVLDRADATAVQVRSVTHRTRFAEAVELGLESLRELGITVPAADRLAAELDHRFGSWYQWLDHTEAAGDLARPDLTDPVLLAASSLIDATQPAAFFLGDPATAAWLGLEALRICLEHGPAPTLIGPAAFTAFGAVVLRGDYAAGYRAARRILALGEARGYEPGTSQARGLFAVLSCWAEPIENSVHASQRAREALIAGGDLASAGYVYYASVPGMLDCAPSLDRYLTEAEAAAAFVRAAFTTGRLDAVNLIAGQLAVSLDNAQLYAGFRRIAEEQAALRRVATLVAQATSPEQVFAAVAKEVGRLLSVDLVTMGRFEPGRTATTVATWGPAGKSFSVGSRWPVEGHNLGTLVFETSRPARMDRYADSVSGSPGAAIREAGIRSVVGAPVIVEGRLWGMIFAGSALDQPLPPDTETRLTSFTELVATAIANAESRSELAASRRRIVAASDEARRRIERDLHDGTQQRLVSLALAARTAEADVAAGRGDLQAELSRIAAGLADAAAELQELSRGIHPAALSEHGLGPALRTLARRSPVPVDLDVTTNARCPEPIEVAAYYVASEALANTMKHAHASHAEISLATRHRSLLLSIRDDGIGGADPARGSGLAGLADRVEALGGSIHVHSAAGAGTRITVDLPLNYELAEGAR